ncbi:hypothetical protein ACE1TI_09710 [Alteribacillus sp. JSM 102045]|uniref:hypothetical protein n=1 Tax=Alteribacillus sp. JSM 102045 TaxID=1562101 RepID=UPI0035C0AA45
MLINVIAGMIIPWIFSFFLYKKYPKVIILLYPLGISIAFISNDWGFDIFWLVALFHDNPSFSALPFNLGYFPFICSLFVYLKLKKIINKTAACYFRFSYDKYRICSCVT